MENNKKNNNQNGSKLMLWQFALILFVIVFAFGYGITRLFNISQIEGYGYNSMLALQNVDIYGESSNENKNESSEEASSGNATSCNATTSNATSCNATSCNATSCNATSSNVSIIKSIFGIGGTTTTNEVVENAITSFKVLNSQVYAGDKVKLAISFKNTDVKYVTLNLYNVEDKNKKISLDVLSILNSPYIMIQNTTTFGEYKIGSITLGTSNKTTTYSEGSTEFNNILSNSNSITINERDKDSILNLKNDEITDEDIMKIKDSDKALEVVIDCSKNNVVKAKVFKAIKDSNSKLVLIYNDHKMTFFGSEINTIKDISFKIDLYDLNKDSNISELINSGYVIEFPNNEELPSKATVTLKVSSDLKGKDLYVYYYNEKTNSLEVVAKNVKYDDGYIEFSIDHNSKFVLSTEDVIDTAVYDNTNVVSFFNSKVIYLCVIAAAIVIIVIVVIIVVVSRKKNKRKLSKNDKKVVDKKEEEQITEGEDEKVKLAEKNVDNVDN